MIHRLISFLVLFTLIVFTNNYPLEESKDNVDSKVTVVDKDDETKMEEHHTEKIYVTVATQMVDLISTTKIDEEITENIKEINDKDNDNRKNKSVNPENIQDIIRTNEENDRYTKDDLRVNPVDNKEEPDRYTKDDKGSNPINEEGDRYTKDNGEVIITKVNIEQGKDKYTKDYPDINPTKMTVKQEPDKYTKDSNAKEDDCETRIIKDIITELSPKSDFDLLQIIFSDAEVIEKRSTDLENSESIIKDSRDLEVAANTVFRPLFVYKRQNERKKFKPFPLFK